jgi:hypothetical protein
MTAKELKEIRRLANKAMKRFVAEQSPEELAKTIQAAGMH